MDQTSKPQASERTPAGFPVWLIWLLLSLPFLYVLGIGPAFRFLPQSVFAPMYIPLVELQAHCPPLDRFITWYMDDVWKCGMW